MKQKIANIPWVVVGEMVALVLVAIATLSTLPLVQAVQTTAALSVAYVAPRWLYVRSAHCSLAGRWVLLVAALFLAAIAVPFLYRCTVRCGASFQMPFLWGDARDYYEWALAHYDGSAVEPKVTFWGYSLLIIALWKVLGVSVIWPVAANVMATLFAIVLTGHVAARIAQSQQSRTATLAMLMIAVQGFFMSQGAQMLKEPWVYLAITLIAYALSGQLEKRYEKGSRFSVFGFQFSGRTRQQTTDNRQPIVHFALVFALGCFILAAVRAKYVNFVFIGIVLLAVAGKMCQWRHYGTLLVITLLCWWLGMAMTDHYTVVQQVNNVTGEGGMATIFAPEGAYDRLLGDYFHYPVWKKLLYLPLTCGVQWIIPFPWLPQGESTQWLSIVPRMRWGWYVLSGVVVYFYLFQSWRRGWQWAVWAWFPMMCFVGIAYMTSGTVSRYILPFEPWWMALAAQPMSRLMSGNPGSKRLVWFVVAYVALMAIVLYLCYMAVGN